MKPRGNVSPNNGGCWYCYNVDDSLSFSCEFDTFVHIECLKEMAKNPEDREAQIMAAELIHE